MKTSSVSYYISHANSNYFVNFERKPGGWHVSINVGEIQYTWNPSPHTRPSLSAAEMFLRIALTPAKEGAA